MYLNILKRDLKRKKASNIIVLIFVILSSMFVSSSVSNLRTITTSLERFMEAANIQDYFIVTMNEKENMQGLDTYLDENKFVDSWNKETLLKIENQNLFNEEYNRVELSNVYWFTCLDKTEHHFFDAKNQIITEVEAGQLYIVPKVSKEMKLYEGDTVYVRVENGNSILYKKFVIAGIMKDAMFDSSMMGGGRFLISDEDYLELMNDFSFYQNYLYNVDTDEVEMFERDFNDQIFSRISAFSRDMVELTYFLDMVIAGILLIVSVCLILISLLILRYILKFSISEEFREIGIMKAIGIKNQYIRKIYGVKYFMIAILGSVIGYFASIPFSNLLLHSISENCMIEPDAVAKEIGLLSSILIAIIVTLFSYSSTKMIKKLSPLNAIRNGQDGNRYHKKGFMKLSKSNMSVATFMACNDIFGYFRRYAVLFVIFILGTILIIVPAISADTLKSDGMLEVIGLHKSEVFLLNIEEQTKAYAEGTLEEYTEEELNTIEKKMNELDYSGRAFINLVYPVKIEKGDLSIVHNANQGVRISASEFDCLEGRQPLYENEVSVTEITAEAVGAELGDTVWIYIGEKSEKNPFIITGYFQTMNNMGQGIRFHEDLNLKGTSTGLAYSYQYLFDEELSRKDIEERINNIRKEFPAYSVDSSTEYINKMVGDSGKQVNQLKWLIIIVMTAIDVLVTVLMVKSFLLKDKTEIALLKAVGFSNRRIIVWQVKRIGIILLTSTVIGILLSNPVAEISVSRIFTIMGAKSIDFVIDPFKSLILYPLIVICSTLLASLLATLQIRNIKTSEVNSIE